MANKSAKLKNCGKSKLHCSKKMSNGLMDMFDVVVSDKDKEKIKKMYKGMGYDVS